MRRPIRTQIVGGATAVLVAAGLGVSLSQSPSVTQPAAQPQLALLSRPLDRASAVAAQQQSRFAGGARGMSTCGTGQAARQPMPDSAPSAVAGRAVSACITGPDLYLHLRELHTPSATIDQLLLNHLSASVGSAGYTELRRLGAPATLAQRLFDRWESDHRSIVDIDGT